MIKYIKYFFIAVIFIAGFESCSDSDSEGERGDLRINLTNTTVVATDIAQFAQVVCSRDWQIVFDYPDAAGAWCSASAMSGRGDQAVAINYSENKAEESRWATIHLISGRDTASATLKQLGKNGAGNEEEPGNNETRKEWMELPALRSQANCQLITHYTTLKDKKVRNYSLFFDTHEKIAYWVAYPHCSAYLGDQKRTDRFQPDPNFSETQQMNSTIKGYDRGHQLPSGDRTGNYEMNMQTFYYSNMTPQLGNFNQRIWVDMEDKVRSWTKSCDTLYVVTGGVLKTAGGNEKVKYVTDNIGNEIAVPNYYFKVLLRLEISGSNRNYSAIGFWFEHKANSGKVTRSYALSVDDIEKKTGIDFFVNLPEVTQERVEAENKPEEWGL